FGDAHCGPYLCDEFVVGLFCRNSHNVPLLNGQLDSHCLECEGIAEFSSKLIQTLAPRTFIDLRTETLEKENQNRSRTETVDKTNLY
ncbi:MAG: hypothetical protein Q8807_04090, partial ['Waltheria sp.' little leaf phytoplasma]|nr:hypothetical protein ['Waltheria sp.' little leaf phytoplasma]